MCLQDDQPVTRRLENRPFPFRDIRFSGAYTESTHAEKDECGYDQIYSLESWGDDVGMRRSRRNFRFVEGDLDGKPIAQRTLDPISEELVAGAKVYDLAKDAQRVEWPWALALSPWTGAKPKPVEVREDGRPRVGVSEDFVNHLDECVRCGLLRPRGPGEHIYEHCGMFGVPKGEEHLRVIFDARRSNERLAPVGSCLVLFTLADLTAQVARFMCGSGCYMLSIDYRHYYYQIPLPKAWAAYFAVTDPREGLPTQRKKKSRREAPGPSKARRQQKKKEGAVDESEDLQKYLPRITAMGWRDACAGAQGLTWTLALHCELDESLLGVDQREVRATCAEGSTPPFVMLYEHLVGRTCRQLTASTERGRPVGALFVLLDGLLTVTNDEALRTRWDERLRRKEKRFHVINRALPGGSSVLRGSGDVRRRHPTSRAQPR